jgi:phosphoserine phosphatase RsbU/P
MGSPQLPAEPSAGRRREPASLPLPPGGDATFSARDLLFKSWPGQLFIGATVIKAIVAVIRAVTELPTFVQLLSSAATIGLAISVGYFVWRLFLLIKRRLLWRVRRKLIVSYIFIGVVPALLLVGFFVLGAWVLLLNVSAYLFKDGYDDVVRNATLLADAASAEIGRSPAAARETLDRVQRNGAAGLRYPLLSLAFVPVSAGAELVRAGEWEHAEMPAEVPEWVLTKPDPFVATIGLRPDGRGESELVVRVVRGANRGGKRIGSVIVDVPIEGQMIDRLHETTGVKAASVRIGTADRAGGDASGELRNTSVQSESLFRQSVTFLDAVDWATGETRRATVLLRYSPQELYQKVSRAQSTQLGYVTLSQGILLVVIVVGILFLVIELIALIMGLALARSITSSVHQLFMGTERVRYGDFTHRITINTKDQLGELATSFNQMTASIENLLQTAAEKKRLEEELRIARQIQMSLLPRGPVEVPGLGVTALCVPAREVGGDYYDFFQLPGDRIGVLIADVAGKGTSAALYMAELKGLVLSLSQIYQSPRQLLIEVNRIISENLDSRSFITMTYVVLDLGAGVMTYARAGHTPLIYLPAGAQSRRSAQVLAPDGLVLGLRIDGAAEKFEALLQEERIDLNTGDVIVLYTDGITEAMNVESDLFGESRLSRIVEEHGHLDSGELRERILREIEAFVGGADQHDDMTMILMKVERAAAARVAV